MRLLKFIRNINPNSVVTLGGFRREEIIAIKSNATLKPYSTAVVPRSHFAMQKTSSNNSGPTSLLDCDLRQNPTYGLTKHFSTMRIWKKILQYCSWLPRP